MFEVSGGPGGALKPPLLKISRVKGRDKNDPAHHMPERGPAMPLLVSKLLRVSYPFHRRGSCRPGPIGIQSDEVNNFLWKAKKVLFFDVFSIENRREIYACSQ